MMQPMANRVRGLDEAVRRAERAGLTIADELREARLAHGLSQDEVGRALGLSRSWVSILERGRARDLTIARLAKHAAVLGLRLSVKLYPVGEPIRDAGQLRYITTFARRVERAWRVRLEVPISLPGDLRAVDLVLDGVCMVAVEVVTRLRDVQAVVRAGQLKQRDIGAQRLIIVVAATHSNRRALAAARNALAATFDLDSRRTMAELTAGRDPGRDAIVLLS